MEKKSSSRQIIYFQQNRRRKFTKLKKEVSIKVQEVCRETKGTENKFPMAHNNQNIKCTKERKILNTTREEKQIIYEGRAFRIT